MSTSRLSRLSHKPLTRVAFRFCFVYFGLYCLATPIVGGLILFPGFSFPSFGALWPMRQSTFWLATSLFRVTTPLVFTGNSGDTTFHWVQTFWLLVFSALAAAIWSRLDRAPSRSTSGFVCSFVLHWPPRCSTTVWPRSFRPSFPRPRSSHSSNRSATCR